MTTKPDDEDLDDHEAIIPHHSQMFAPKSLVLITQHDYFETFRVISFEHIKRYCLFTELL